MTKYPSTIYKNSHEKVVDSTTHIGANLQSKKASPPPSVLERKEKVQETVFYRLEGAPCNNGL